MSLLNLATKNNIFYILDTRKQKTGKLRISWILGLNIIEVMYLLVFMPPKANKNFESYANNGTPITYK